MHPLFEMLDHGERGGASLLPHLLHVHPLFGPIIIIIIVMLCVQ